ncbi:MAG TPA: hypothetical protein VLW85_14065 [Myxococcales bacterium]|nr:hypothetical protein [Myxococcales bacterium]
MKRTLLLALLVTACAHARQTTQVKYAGPRDAIMDPAATYGPSTTLMWR